jgi:hypothetical protein
VVQGKQLHEGEETRAKIFLIVSSKGIVLRASLIREIAEMYCDNDTRFLYEGHLV